MKTSRSKQYRLQLTYRRQLFITVRRFYAAKSRRSQRHRQLVVDLDLGPFKEVAFRIQTRKRPTKIVRVGHWRLQPSLPLLIAGAGVIGITYSTTHLVAARALEPVQTFSAVATNQQGKPKPAATPTLPASTPTHIDIPSVQIDADIIPVGLAANGSIELPPVLSWEAGWYKNSPTPGQLGPAIIVGHVDSYENISVFWRLRYITAGDIVSIVRSDGTTAKFQVTALDQYDQNNFPTATVYGNLDYAGVKIITCGGTFDEATGNYSQNTVVTGKLLAS